MRPLAETRTRRRSFAIDCGALAVLVALNLLVIAPFLTMDFSSQPWNNDYTYIGMSRMFRDRPWSWNSLQYGGAPFHYLYPPLFHLLVTWLPVGSLGRAYHLVSGASYALVPAAFYIAALALFRSRRLAGALALVQSFSPTVLYYLLPAFAGFAGNYRRGPWNFVALIASNESAHTLSLVLILLVLAAAWRDRWLAASLGAAAVFLLNWAGIIGLLMVLAAVAVARSRELGFRQAALRVAGVAGIGYGLAAFWVSPDCIYTTKLLDRIVLRHIQPSTPWNAVTGMVLAGAAVLLAISLWPRIKPVAAFTLALLAISGAVVIAYSAAGNYLLPLPHRYIQEFNVGLVLAIGCLAAAAWQWRRPLGALVLVLGALPAVPFLMGAWRVQQPGIDPHSTAAFQISDWLAHHAGSSRVLVAGELEGTLNIWTDVAQAGGSAQGVSNYLVPAAHRQITLGCGEEQASARIAELWLRALDVRYLVVHGPASAEHFHWFVQPERFAAWPAVWTNGAGDTIYRLPPPDEQRAVVVDLVQMKQLPTLRATDDARFLEAYVAWARGKRPAHIAWFSPDRFQLMADAGPNEAVLVKVNYDAGWTASAGTTATDPIGFLLVKGTPARPVSLRFGASWSVWLGRAVTAATILLLLWRPPLWVIAAVALIPAVSAYGVLQFRTPALAAVAGEAYRRLQPPLINPSGIVDGVTLAQPPLARGSVFTIFGANFGSASDRVRVRIGQREGEILYRGPNQVNVRMPGDAAPAVDVSLEVNGCRGNSFAVATKPAP
ncbi:MAG TPA: IPT/TIG domain-containing protein [Bryobacteraceae bacterium]|nr:IPT/TIG domain-containing protein [Bryobacteraceae bacterium]